MDINPYLKAARDYAAGDKIEYVARVDLSILMHHLADLRGHDLTCFAELLTGKSVGLLVKSSRFHARPSEISILTAVRNWLFNERMRRAPA